MATEGQPPIASESTPEDSEEVPIATEGLPPMATEGQPPIGSESTPGDFEEVPTSEEQPPVGSESTPADHNAYVAKSHALHEEPAHLANAANYMLVDCFTGFGMASKESVNKYYATLAEVQDWAHCDSRIDEEHTLAKLVEAQAAP